MPTLYRTSAIKKYCQNLLLAFGCFACLVASTQAMEITGNLQLSGSEAKSASIGDAIVYFLPDDKSQAPVDPGEFTLNMVRKQFVPRTLAVPVGSKVNIPNNDTISHNAFSPSTPNNFDLKYYGRGESDSFIVQGPGVVRIYCNVHYHMVAYVLGLETPFFTQPDANGNFTLTVPDIPGQLVVWHERTQDHIETIQPGQPNQIRATLRITKRRLPVHNNKFGRNYRRDR